jgi:hypothetical protein
MFFWYVCNRLSFSTEISITSVFFLTWAVWFLLFVLVHIIIIIIIKHLFSPFADIIFSGHIISLSISDCLLSLADQSHGVFFFFLLLQSDINSVQMQTV